MSHLKRVIAVVLLLPCLAGPSLADERGHQRGREAAGRPGWHGEISRFHEHDIGVWRDGRWHHGRHDGRVGWWWIVGGLWYFYPARVEPYPDPYRPPVVTQVVVQPPAVQPPPPAAPQYWYYCTNPAGYYPYVARCPAGWQQVPATVPADLAPR